MGSRTSSGAGWACLFSADLSNLRSSFQRSLTQGLGTSAERGISLMRTGRETVIKSVYANFVDGTSALLPTVQVETEFAKDRWDARNIPGLRYAPHRNNYYIKFEGVPEIFRLVVKDYAKFQVAADRAAKTLDQCVYYLGR